VILRILSAYSRRNGGQVRGSTGLAPPRRRSRRKAGARARRRSRGRGTWNSGARGGS
jgi:hypothetical protein